MTAGELDPGARRGLVLSGVMAAVFLAAMESTVVATAMPTVIASLGGIRIYSWTFSAFLLTSTVTMPIWGRLADQVGRRPAYLAGLTLFLLGSAFAGLSGSMEQLIAFRALQGLGAGSLISIGMTIVGDLYGVEQRAKMQGYFSSVWGVASLVGPLVGGLLTDRVSWRWVFYINIPFGLLAAAAIAIGLRDEGRNRPRASFDLLGMGVFAAAISTLLVGLVEIGAGESRRSTGVGLLVLSVVLLVLFVLVERRVAEPVIPLRLFRNRTFSASMLSIFFATFGFGALIIFLPFYFLIVEGVSYTESGYRFLPFMFGLITSSIISGQLVSRTGRYKPYIIGGILILIVGQLLMTNLRVGTSDVSLATWMFISGLGIGPTFAVFTIVVQNAVPFQQLGAATSDLTLFRQIGTTIGIAVAFVVFRLNLTWDLLRDQLIAAGAPAALVPTTQPAGFDIAQLTNVSAGAGSNPLGQIPAEFLPIFERGFHSALTIAIANSIWLGVGAAIIAVVSAFFLKEIPLRTTLGARTPAPAAQPMQATPAAD